MKEAKMSIDVDDLCSSSDEAAAGLQKSPGRGLGRRPRVHYVHVSLPMISPSVCISSKMCHSL